MLKYSFIFLFLFSNLFAEPRLTIPKDIDMGIIPLGIERVSYIDIKNNTKDTFILDKINYYQMYSYNISFNGNALWSFSLLNSLYNSPIIILPNEIRTFNYSIDSKYEDSISLSGGKLRNLIDLGYYKYGSNKLIKDSFNIYFSCKKMLDTVFLNTSGISLDFNYCHTYLENIFSKSLMNLYNKYNHEIVLDSISFFNGDSVLNFYGVINNRSKVTLPEIKIDSLPINIKS